MSINLKDYKHKKIVITTDENTFTFALTKDALSMRNVHHAYQYSLIPKDEYIKVEGDICFDEGLVFQVVRQTQENEIILPEICYNNTKREISIEDAHEIAELKEIISLRESINDCKLQKVAELYKDNKITDDWICKEYGKVFHHDLLNYIALEFASINKALNKMNKYVVNHN